MAIHRRRTTSISISVRRAVLGVVVALGVLATQACNTPSPGPDTHTPPTTAAPVVTTTADPTAGWTPYSDASIHLVLRYPPAWQQRQCSAGDHTALYLAPTMDALGVCMSDNTGQISIAALDGDQRSALHLTGSGLTSTSVTVSGVAGTMEQDTAVASDVGPVAGTVEVAYVFFAHGLTYRLAYSQAPSGPTSTDVRTDFDLTIHNTLDLS
jgi:hypothetical protein